MTMTPKGPIIIRLSLSLLLFAIIITPTFLIIDPDTWEKPIYNYVQSIVLKASTRDFETEGL